MGMGVSFLFIFLSFTQPLKKLQKERPPASIFHWSLTLSVFGQFCMHLYVLVYLVNLCEPHIDRNDDSFIPDGEFKPNLKNSVMFVYQWWLQCAVIVVNYSGRPFMQSMNENSKLKWLLVANFWVLTTCVFNGSDELRELFELVPYPDEDFKWNVIQMLCLDLGFCYALESACKWKYLRSFQEED
jgi:cation-transporting ATPase 13A1